jgi:hypothetical protein
VLLLGDGRVVGVAPITDAPELPISVAVGRGVYTTVGVALGLGVPGVSVGWAVSVNCAGSGVNVGGGGIGVDVAAVVGREVGVLRAIAALCSVTQRVAA